MKRREFLEAAALGVGALTLGTVQARETAIEPTDPLAMVQLTPEIKCSRIGFGTGMRGSNRQSDLTRAGWSKGIEMLQYAYDRGVRLFDCADMYGTHFVVAEALKGKPRDSYTIVSKIWLRPGGIPELERLTPEQTLPRLLRECKTDYIDVLQLHCMADDRWTTQYADAMEGMEQLKKKGLIRAHGISSHSNAATELAAKTPWCDVVHVRINSEGMNMDGPKDDAAKRIEETLRTTNMLREAGKGVIAMKVLGEGKMSGNPDMRKKSTKYVCGLDCVQVMIVGFTEKEHISEFIENVKAAS